MKKINIGDKIRLIQSIKREGIMVKENTVGTIVNIDDEDEFMPIQVKFETDERLWLSYNTKMRKVEC